MKFMKYSASMAIVTVALSLGAFAKDSSNSGNFTLSDRVQVGSTQLAPGDYKAEWSGPADNVKVTITRHGKTVATAEGKLKDLQQKAPYSAVLTKQTDNNMLQLDEIEFSNRTQALQLGGE